MKITSRQSISDELRKYDYLSKEHDFIEITEWENGEGWDINIGEVHLAFSRGQLDAINHLTKCLEYGD